MNQYKALKMLNKSAVLYDQKINNKEICFIAGDPSSPQIFETKFRSSNYLHLTGVKFNPGNTISANEFFKLCLTNRLKIDKLDFYSSNTTRLKISILTELTHMAEKGLMISEYNNKKNLLITEKLIGDKPYCIGFIHPSTEDKYIPNTALKGDINKLSLNPPKNVITVLQKNIGDPLYMKLSYLGSTVKFEDIQFPPEIKDQIDPSMYAKKTIEPVVEEQLPGIDDLIAQAIAQADEYNSSHDITKDKSKDQDLEI